MKPNKQNTKVISQAKLDELKKRINFGPDFECGVFLNGRKIEAPKFKPGEGPSDYVPLVVTLQNSKGNKKEFSAIVSRETAFAMRDFIKDRENKNND